MKKNTVLIAVLAVMSGMCTAKAGEIDFDGKSTGALRSVNFAISNAEVNQEIPAAPVPAPDINQSAPLTQDIDSMSADDREKLNTHLDSSIRTAMDYCNRNHLNELRGHLAELLVRGDVKEKFRFVNNPEKKYVFQNNGPVGTELLAAASVQQKGGVPVCMSWGTQNVCVKKEVIKKVCTAGVLVCVAGSIATTGTTAPVCTMTAATCAFVTEWMDECNDVPYCTQWYTEVM